MNSNQIAKTWSRVTAEALVEALLQRYHQLSLLDSQLIPSDGTTPIYTVDVEGVWHVQMAGGTDTILLDLVREFASGFISVADKTSETQRATNPTKPQCRFRLHGSRTARDSGNEERK